MAAAAAAAAVGQRRLAQTTTRIQKPTKTTGTRKTFFTLSDNQNKSTTAWYHRGHAGLPTPRRRSRASLSVGTRENDAGCAAISQYAFQNTGTGIKIVSVVERN